MMKKRLSKKIWYGSDVDSEGNPVLPPLAIDSDDLEGLHYGELYLHIADDKLSLWTRTLTDQVKQIGGSGSGDGELWQLRQTDAGEPYLFSPFDVAVQRGLTSFVDGGSLDLPSIYDGLPIDNQTLYWEEVTEQVGTDEEGNPIYETTKVLKAAGGGTGGGGVADSVDWTNILNKPTTIEGYGIADEVVSSNKGQRMIWGQPLAGTKNITGELNLGTSGLLRKSSPYNDYDNIRIEMLERTNNYPPRLSIQASDYNGISPQGFVSIGGIGDAMLQHFYILSLETDVWGKLKLIADGELLGNTAKGIEMYVDSDKVLNIDAASGLKVSKFFYNGVDTFNLNNGEMKYNKDEGYWMFDGNLVVTGGLTTFADSGAGNQWIMDAETLEEVTSDNQFKVYSAKVTSMIAGKLSSIKTAFSGLSSSSSASDIGGALKLLSETL